MKKVFLIVLLFIATSIKLMAEDNSIVYVFQYNELSKYVVVYSDVSSEWEVYSLNATQTLCPTMCGTDQLLYANEDRGTCMEWALSDLGYDPDGFPRYWGDYKDEHAFYVINNYSYDYVKNFVKTETMCPTMCSNNRFAANQPAEFFSFSINENQVFYTAIPSDENIIMEIYDYTGKLIYTKSIISDSNQTHVDKVMVTGIYFIKFTSNAFSKTIKALIN